MSAEELVSLFREGKPQPEPFRLATVASGYASGRPRLIFDGETDATTRTWPMGAGLTLAAGNQVLVAMVGSGGVVVCKVV